MLKSSLHQACPNEVPERTGSTEKIELVLIFLLGFSIRAFACQYTYVINPDGVYYIHQARAIYYGLWGDLTNCHISFISNYPFFIAATHALLRDWVVAAKATSLIFGSATLVPLYLLLRRFLNRDVSRLGTLAFALIPVFVSRSADVVRDPVSWFFVTLGLYLFINANEKRFRFLLFISCLSFLMASWARIECILFVFVSCFYLVLMPQKNRFQRLSFFSMPFAVILLFIVITAFFYKLPVADMVRLNEVGEKLLAPFKAYSDLRQSLSQIMAQPFADGETVPYFLHKARHLVWLIALGTLFKYMLTAYFYPFFLLFVLGSEKFWKCMKKDPNARYLFFLAASVFALLYLHVIHRWMMFDRFWGIFIIPTFLALAFGLEKAADFLTRKYKIKQSSALAILCFLMLVCSLPKCLKPKEADKLVFKEIGTLIADIENHKKETRIAESPKTPNWVSFYANLDSEGAPCPSVNLDFDLTTRKYETFVRDLKAEKVTYFLWKEKTWPKYGFNFFKEMRHGDFEEIGKWYHPDTGDLILFRLKY